FLEHAGQQFSTIDLYSRSFVLLTGTEGNVWCAAARTVSERMGLVLDAYRVGKGGDYSDSKGNFLTTYGITSAGAVLIRPDGFMAWRSRDAVENAEGTLEQTLSVLLFR
ncbi:MAG TPA: hypothetical protein VFB12_23605, partial [Ktedonobacteraceae bacterium]|nr:hypothetical protein [Ktedonobacteraceae bacterium]